MVELNVNVLLGQVANVLIKPKEAFDKIKKEKVGMQSLFLCLAIVAIPTLVGAILGYGVIGNGSKMSVGWAIGTGIVLYVFSIVAVLFFGYILNAIAPIFKLEQNLDQSMKLAVYSATPWLIGGIFFLYYPIG